MPGGDRTGPRGGGPRTGRAAGFCVGNDSPGYMNPGVGYGAGYGGGWYRGGAGGRGGGHFGHGAGMGGRGGGWGYRHVYNATGLPLWMRGGWGGGPYYDTAGYESAVDEAEILKREEDFLEKRLKSISDRIKDLEKDSETGGD